MTYIFIYIFTKYSIVLYRAAHVNICHQESTLLTGIYRCWTFLYFHIPSHISHTFISLGNSGHTCEIFIGDHRISSALFSSVKAHRWTRWVGAACATCRWGSMRFFAAPISDRTGSTKGADLAVFAPWLILPLKMFESIQNLCHAWPQMAPVKHVKTCKDTRIHQVISCHFMIFHLTCFRPWCATRNKLHDYTDARL